MPSDTPFHRDSVPPHGFDAASVPTRPASDSGRRHWLGADLILQSLSTWGNQRLSPSVVDIDGELNFWRRHHQRTAAWHRDVLPFPDYIPAFTLGISLFLQCHDHVLEALNEQMLAVRYARLRRTSRVEWHEARQAIRAAYVRLQSHWEAAPARTLLAETIAPPPPRSRPGRSSTGARRGRELS